MKNIKTLLLLIFLLIILFIFTVLSFDYESYLKTNSNIIENKTTKTIKKQNYINLEIIKEDQAVSISGTFVDKQQLEYLFDNLNLNKKSSSTFDKTLSFKKENFELVKKLVSPLKDYFKMGSKLILKDSKVIIEGQIKNKKYKDLVDAIISKHNIIFVKRVLINEDEDIKEEVSNNKVEEVKPEEFKEENTLKQEEIKEPIEEDVSLQDEINSLLKNQKITFKRRSVEIAEESKIVLEDIAQLLIANKQDIKVEIAGHTDAKGKKSLNRRISLNRANSVKTELVKLGVPKEILKAVGYGEDKPLVKNDKNGLSEINRRVEFVITDLNALKEKKEAFQEEIDSLLQENKITFKRRSYEIANSSIDTVKKIAQILKNKDILEVEIAGHTDAKGKKELNKTISKLRALAVKKELAKYGISKRKLKAIGYGEEKPLVENDENGLSEINRRVEIYIKGVK